MTASAPRKSGPKPAAHETRADSTQAVNEYMATLEHPCKAEIEVLREIVRGADASIQEGIKLKAPSFRTHEYFATTPCARRRASG